MPRRVKRCAAIAAPLFFLFLLPCAGAISADGLLGYWRLNGDLADSSPLLNPSRPPFHGAFTSGQSPSFVPGHDGSAVDFTHVPGHLIDTGLLLGGGPKTLILWVKSELQTGDGRTIWAGNKPGVNQRFYVGLQDDGPAWHPWIGGGSGHHYGGSFPANPNNGQWHFYALTDSGSGGELRVYQNGNPAASFTLDYSGSTASPESYGFVIGGSGGTGSPRFADAAIDDVAVFGRVLTTGEMAAIYQAGNLWDAIGPAPFLSDLDGACREVERGGHAVLGPVALRDPQGPVGYQWYFKGKPIPGETGASLSVSSATYHHAGVYHVTADDGRVGGPVRSTHTWLAIKPNLALPSRGICAHRGASSTHPENTLAAFREAIRLGAHQIELDVTLTNYGDLVVIHDSTVNRTTNGTGSVKEKTLAQIKALDAGSWKGSQFAGERIPTLQEALEIMPHNVWLNLDMKDNTAELGLAVAKVVLDHGRSHQSILSSRRNAAVAARALYENLIIGNMSRQDETALYIGETIEHGDDFIQLLSSAGLPTAAEIQPLIDAGVRINLYSSSNPAELASLYGLGIDFPLVNNVAQMMTGAVNLGIPRVNPVYLVPFTPALAISRKGGGIEASYRRYAGDESWQIDISSDLSDWKALGESPFSVSRTVTGNGDGTEDVHLKPEGNPDRIFFRLSHPSWWW